MPLSVTVLRVFQSVQSAVSAVSAQKRILAFNPTAEKLTRLQARQVVHAHRETLPVPLHRLGEETIAGGPVTNERLSQHSRGNARPRHGLALRG